MTQLMPFSTFVFHDQNTNSRRFRIYADHLMNANFQFFTDKAQNDKTGFLFSVRIKFDPRYSKFISTDLSAFPQLIEVVRESLSNAQTRNMKQTKFRRKLVSSCHEQIVTDFAPSLAYQQLLFSAEILEVLDVTTFIMWDFLRPYVSRISKHRALTKSKVMQKTCKSESFSPSHSTLYSCHTSEDLICIATHPTISFTLLSLQI